MLIRKSFAWDICRKRFVERIKTVLYILQTKIPLRKQHPLLLFSNVSEKFNISFKYRVQFKKEKKPISSVFTWTFHIHVYKCINNSHLIIFSVVSKITIFIEIYELGWDKLYICLYGTFCYVTLLWIVDYRCFKIKVAFYHVLSNSIKVCHQNLCLLEYA